MNDFGLLALKESTKFTRKGGEGVPLSCRVRPQVKEFIEGKADELGISISNYVDLYFVEEMAKGYVDTDGAEIDDEL